MQGDMKWLLRLITIEAREEDHNLFPNAKFASAVDLWKRYIVGYLRGLFSPDGDIRHVFIVRYEDLLNQPSAIIDELTRLGFPRNENAFQPILKNLRNPEQTRGHIRDRESKGVTWTPEVLATVTGQLEGYEGLVRALRYLLPATVAQDAPLPAGSATTPSPMSPPMSFGPPGQTKAATETTGTTAKSGGTGSRGRAKAPPPSASTACQKGPSSVPPAVGCPYLICWATRTSGSHDQGRD